MAQIDILVKGERAQQNRTFDKKRLANIWIAKRSKEIRILIDQGKAGQLKAKRRTLADAIKTYIDSHQRDMGPTKRQEMNTLLNDYEISQRACGDITSQDIVALAQELSNGGRSPSTVHIYLSSLSSVFAIGDAAWGFDLNRTATMDAMAACSRLGITGRSKSRDRRLTLDELDAILSHFEASHRQNSLFAPILKIALFASKRQQKRELLFGTNNNVISRRWTEACRVSGIEKLAFHDLRHQGISRLFEIRLTLPQGRRSLRPPVLDLDAALPPPTLAGRQV